MALEAELVSDIYAPYIEIVGLPIHEKRPASSRPSNTPIA
jgi:hypothetical protein